VKGLSEATATRIVDSRRQHGPFKALNELRQRAAIPTNELQALSAADALSTISGHRHQTQWQVLGLPEHRPLLASLDNTENYQSPSIEAPSVAENVLADYQSTGLTLRDHPLSLLRKEWPFKRCSTHRELLAASSQRFVRIAGLVTCKQRPGTASGVIFLTLEDETGNHNVVVWPKLQERCRQALMNARLLVVKGTLERKDNVSHIIAGDLEDYTHVLASLSIKARAYR
jgi:error-prone DNA polymerase